MSSYLDRLTEAIRKIIRSEFADYSYTGIYSYSIATVTPNLLTGEVTIDAEPTDTTLSLPPISKMQFKGVNYPVVGEVCYVSFINRSPKNPIVVNVDGSIPAEHIMTTEATALLIYNVFVTLMAAAGGGPLLAVVLQPLLGTAILAALTAQGVPAPPTLPAQIAAAAAQLAGFATGVAPATTSIYFKPAIDALSTKTENVSGVFPSVGCSNTKSS